MGGLSVLNIANFCSHLRNVSKAKMGLTSVKNTKYNLRVALAMHRAGFFSSVYRGDRTPPTAEQMISVVPQFLTSATVAHSRIWIGLKYWDGRPVLADIQMVSQPRRPMTATVRQLQELAQGLPTQVTGGRVRGLNLGECMFVGTSNGILELREALSQNLGGLLICRAL